MWGGSSKGSKQEIETGYYDDNGNWIEYDQDGYYDVNKIPDGNVHDGEGRLLDPSRLHAELGDQEDPAIFISEFKPPRMVKSIIKITYYFIIMIIIMNIYKYIYNSVQLLMQCLYL